MAIILINATKWADYYNNKCIENKDWVNPRSHGGEFLAECQCPSGISYQVGSRTDKCENPRCFGGKITKCIGEPSDKSILSSMRTPITPSVHCGQEVLPNEK